MESPELSASWFSKIFFLWTLPILRIGLKRDIEVSDIYSIHPRASTKKLATDIWRAWEYERIKNPLNPSLVKAICRTLLWDFILSVLLWILCMCIIKTIPIILPAIFCLQSFAGHHLPGGHIAGRNIQALAVGHVVIYFEMGMETSHGLSAAGIIVVCCVLQIVTFHWAVFLSQRFAMKLRVSTCSLIYEKVLHAMIEKCWGRKYPNLNNINDVGNALKLSEFSLAGESIGQVTNLVSNDVNRFDRFAVFLPFIIVGPIQVVVVGGVLSNYVGVSSIVGILLLILLALLQALFGRFFGKIRAIVAQNSDSRVRLLSEIISGIHLVKVLTWERIQARIVQNARKIELQFLRKKGRYDAVNRSIYEASGRIAVLITLSVYSFTGSRLTIPMVFVTVCLYDSLKGIVSVLFATSVMGVSESLVSLRRIQKFLLQEEMVPTVNKTSVENPPNGLIAMNNFSAAWNLSSECILKDINIQIHPGKLVALIGPVGSGKTSILQGILEELPPRTGSVCVVGKIAYCPQDPALFNGSIRDNILFGGEMKADWYREVLEACALAQDIEPFPSGDLTLVGDHGLNLSGGQRARVNLARAIYADAQICLLDDPLSALDVRVGKHVFENAILRLLRNKTVVLITHQLQVLNFVDQVIVLDDGRVAKIIEKSDIDSYIQTNTKEIGFPRMPTVDDLADDKNSDVPISWNVVQPETIGKFQKLGGVDSCYGTFINPQAETRSTGLVPASLYWKYLRAGNSIRLLLIYILTIVLSQAFYSASDYCLKLWKTPPALSFNSPAVHHYLFTYFAYFAALIAIGYAIALCKFQLLFYTCLNSSQVLHERLVWAILRAPMTYFENNTSGRVLNRCVNDVGTMDENATQLLVAVLSSASQIAGSLAIVVILSPAMVVVMIGLLILVLLLRRRYLCMATSLKRMESILRSPILSHVTTTGLTTIHAFKREAELIVKYYEIQDTHSSAFYMTIVTQRLFGVLVDSISFLYVAAIVAWFTFTNTDGATVGLALSSAISMFNSLGWAMTQSVEMEAQFVAVERIVETSNVKAEAPLQVPSKKPPPTWPTRGGVRFDYLSLVYGNNPPALNGISCEIQPKEKIGIVGRTGAGKSSFLSCLLRTVEPSAGLIHIDHLNILHIGIHDLRSKISIIPQDPFLFTGTIHRNLDPQQIYPKSDVWTAIQKVHMGKRIGDKMLETLVSNGGTNFSVGERQLICLARAILTRNKILIMDEATAHLDSKTDRLIQSVVRSEFKESTILTIAHRLETVMDSDRICFIDKGQLVEFDEPFLLLRNPNARLTRLVTKTGDDVCNYLLQLAKKAYYLKHDMGNNTIVEEEEKLYKSPTIVQSSK